MGLLAQLKLLAIFSHKSGHDNVKIMQTHRKYEHTQFHCDACALRVNKVRDGGLIYINTVPNPEVLQANVNWLHPVCIYGCFALLGLISAVHSRITHYFNAMFRLGWVRARIVYTYA